MSNIYLNSIRIIDHTTGQYIQAADQSLGSSAQASSLFFPIGFAGGLRDKHTKFVRFIARDYYPNIGRFTAPDPANDLRGDADLYDYCVDDPVSKADYMGLAWDFPYTLNAMKNRNKRMDGRLDDKISIEELENFVAKSAKMKSPKDYKKRSHADYYYEQAPENARVAKAPEKSLGQFIKNVGSSSANFASSIKM